MTTENYHRSLAPLEEACTLAHSDWVCIPNPLIGWAREGSVFWKIGVLLRHVKLVGKCWWASRHRNLLVREFSTWPLLLIFPLLWPLRKKIFFLMHHNLQWARRSRVQRVGLAMLAKLGARWALLERQDFQGLEKCNIPSSCNLILWHPVSGVSSSGKKKQGRPVIGLAGYYRPEKGTEQLVGILQEAFPDTIILLGSSGPDDVAHLQVEIEDTASDADYRRMLMRCDVLVQNGTEDGYFYRASGPVADAAACAAAVVVPDFPLLNHQVRVPVPVGEVFQDEVGIPAAVQRAIEHVRSGKYDFGKYCRSRSASALAEQLDEFDKRQHETG